MATENVEVGNTVDKKTAQYSEEVKHQQALRMQGRQGNSKMVSRTFTEKSTVTVTSIFQR